MWRGLILSTRTDSKSLCLPSFPLFPVSPPHFPLPLSLPSPISLPPSLTFSLRPCVDLLSRGYSGGLRVDSREKTEGVREDVSAP